MGCQLKQWLEIACNEQFEDGSPVSLELISSMRRFQSTLWLSAMASSSTFTEFSRILWYLA